MKPSIQLLLAPHRWKFALFILVLVSMACAVPGLSSQAPSPVPATAQAPVVATVSAAEPTAEATEEIRTLNLQNAPPPQDLPPALVEVDPQPLSELKPGSQPAFYFNQAMDRASVEAAFQAQPSLTGRFEWVDDSTLRYIPDQLPGPDQELALVIQPGARAANGKSLADPLEIRYRTPGPLQVANRLPEPNAVDVDPSSAVVAAFNRPVVPLGVDSANLPPGFSIEPATGGRGEWINTSTYIFYPQPALFGGVTYTIRVQPDLANFAGLSLDAGSPTEWQFTTAAPKLLSITPSTEVPLPLDAPLVFEFNQPMDPVSTETSFSFISAEEGPVPGKFSWNETSTQMTFQPDALLERNSEYTLILLGAAASRGGTTLGQDVAARLYTYRPLSVLSSAPRWQGVVDLSGGYGAVTVNFSAPLKPKQDWKSLISLNPVPSEVNYFVSDTGTQLIISGYFSPSKSYDLTISTDLRDRWNGMLDETFYLTFSTTRADPSLVVSVLQYGYPAVFIPEGEAEIPARTTNVSRVSFSRGELSLVEFIQGLQDRQTLPDLASRIDASWVKLYYPDNNVTESVGLPTTASGQALDPGLYFLKIEPTIGQEAVSNPPALLVVSPVQMVLKVSNRQAFVWTVNLGDNTPVADTLVSFYDSTANIIGTCSTDVHGTCEAEIAPRSQPYSPIFAVIGQPGDEGFSLASSNWDLGLASWNFGLASDLHPSATELYLYTDRPIYRPGQMVHFRAVARGYDNGRYSPTDKTGLSFKVDTYDQTTGENRMITELSLPVSAFGTASGDFTLPEDIAPGTYYLNETSTPESGIMFKVAKYRKPEIDLGVTFARESYLYGSDLTVGVDAKYFFGAPAGNLDVTWVLYARDQQFPLPDGLSSGRVDTAWEDSLSMSPWTGTGPGFYVIEGKGKTALDGSLIVTVKGDELRGLLQADRSYHLTLEVTAEDESGLPVSSRGNTWLHPSSFFIGIRPETWMGVADEETIFYVKTLDWDAKAKAGIELSARFRKVNWIQEQLDSGAITYRPEYSDAGSTDFSTSDKGEARLAFTPSDPGTYLLEVIEKGAAEGTGAISQQMLWVGGAGSATWPNLIAEHIDLRSEFKSYEPGQTARIFIPNPLGIPALALITVERGKVMQSSVITIEDSSYLLDLPLTDAEAPNIYVSVILMGRMNNRPTFRIGYTELDVKPVNEVLNVVVEPSTDQPGPGSEVTLNVRVKDSAGNPVEGEFSLSVVDKAVLALADPNAPGIAAAFYDPQPLGVFTGMSLAFYSGRYTAPPGGRGGGGEGAQVPAGVRQQFEDTAYWTGTLVTDVDGVGQVTITLPDNLTTWQVEARGITQDSRVGEAQAFLVTSRPLLVRPVTPRFVVLGDHLEMAAVVHNNTQDVLTAEVSLAQTAGFVLDNVGQSVQTVELQPAERKRVSWWGTVQDVEALDLEFSASAGSLRDATRPEQGSIPVLRSAASQSFRSAGVLAEAGERIEGVALPRSFAPVGGGLRVELNASLAGVVFDAIDADQKDPLDMTEPVVSKLLSDLAGYRLAVDLALRDETYQQAMRSKIEDGVRRLNRTQNSDGGWGWASEQESDPYLTTYALFGLGKASQAGFFIDPKLFQKAQEYLVPLLTQPSVESDGWALDRLAFQYLALQQVGRSDLNVNGLYDLRERLTPWGKSMLAMTLYAIQPQDERARTMLSDLQSGALRYSTGAHWEGTAESWHNWNGTAVTTAAVTGALAKAVPDSPVITDAVRYLVYNRRAVSSTARAWDSHFETAWVVQALAETLYSSSELQPGFDYSASLNGVGLLSGRMEGSGALEPVSVWTPAADLRANAITALKISRSEGSGRLYYDASLEVARPVENAPAVQRGLSITRSYYLTGQDCQANVCQPTSSLSLQNAQPVLVRLTLTVPEDMYYVAVEDWIPAGSEILNPRLKTSSQGSLVNPGFEEPVADINPVERQFEASDPFREGWGWWLFSEPLARDESIRWVAQYLPAGTYELTYRLTIFLPGEFRLLPAHAWQIYFPEVEGSTSGSILTIQP